MNFDGRDRRTPLPPCPVCGKDGGRRKATAEVIERYAVKCENCGAMTKLYSRQSAATNAWKRGEAERRNKK